MTQQLENETFSPLATDPWINESVHQAGASMGWAWWEISALLNAACSEAGPVASHPYCSWPQSSDLAESCPSSFCTATHQFQRISVLIPGPWATLLVFRVQCYVLPGC